MLDQDRRFDSRDFFHRRERVPHHETHRKQGIALDSDIDGRGIRRFQYQRANWHARREINGHAGPQRLAKNHKLFGAGAFGHPFVSGIRISTEPLLRG